MRFDLRQTFERNYSIGVKTVIFFAEMSELVDQGTIIRNTKRQENIKNTTNYVRHHECIIRMAYTRSFKLEYLLKQEVVF